MLVTFHLNSVGSPLQSCTADVCLEQCFKENLLDSNAKHSDTARQCLSQTLFTWHSNFVE